MKNKIYIIVLALLSLSMILILGFYYTQDFTEELDFNKSVNYADIEIQTREIKDVTYLSGATATLGKLKLKNNGYFTQEYSVPQLRGCVVLKDTTNKILSFFVELEPTYNGNEKNRQMSIKVGEEKEYELVGKYNDYYGNYLMSLFTRENIDSIKIYKLPKDNLNPLEENYRYNYNKEENSCEYLMDNKIPLATILIN